MTDHVKRVLPTSHARCAHCDCVILASDKVYTCVTNEAKPRELIFHQECLETEGDVDADD